MKCPVCTEQQLKSNVYPGMSSTTLMWCAPYYDEDGIYHHHDMNRTRSEYSCTQGHAWSVTSHPICPADNCTFNDGNTDQVTIHAQ
jgi:hypothetical protein